MIRYRNSLLLATVLGSTLVYVLFKLYVDFTLGGNEFKQGDWLIHGLAGSIRRGHLGTALLLTTDWLGISPLLMLIIVQGVIITSIFLVIIIAALNLGAPDKLVLILLSPAFLIFWFNDPQASMRKEILAYLAFIPLIIAASRDRAITIACVFSCVFYCIAVFSHEGNVFIFPFLSAGIWLVLPSNMNLAVRYFVTSIPGILAAAAGVYAVMNTALSDTDGICMHLVQRGLRPGICGGVIGYLSTKGSGVLMPFSRFLMMDFRNFLLLYAVCLLPFRIMCQGSNKEHVWFVGMVASGLMFLPLYFLATDFGRWLNFHISALGLLILIYVGKCRPNWFYIKPRCMDFFALLFLNLVMGITHNPGELTDGFLITIARTIAT